MSSAAPTAVASLDGRTALVTGAGNGLGRAIAFSLAGAGIRVLLVGRDHKRLDAVAAELSSSPAGCRVETVDVAEPESVVALAHRLADEQISVLVNNAGVAGPVANLVDIGACEWDAVFAVNVRGIYLMCRAFLPPMIARSAGDIINIASVSGKRPLPGRSPYAASKMAVIGLTTTLAWEVGSLGVSVNCLSPGPVSGERMRRNFRLDAALNDTTYEQAERTFTSRAALGRMIEEPEVGAAVVAMLSMPGLCGADIDLSAGMVAR